MSPIYVLKFDSQRTQVEIKQRSRRKTRSRWLDLDVSDGSSLQIPHYGNDDDDPNGGDVSSGSTSSANLRSHPRISRL